MSVCVCLVLCSLRKTNVSYTSKGTIKKSPTRSVKITSHCVLYALDMRFVSFSSLCILCMVCIYHHLFLAHRIRTCFLTRFAHIFLLLLARRRFFAFQQNAVKVAMKDRCACERARVSVSVIVCLICLMYCLWSSIGVYVCNLDRWVGVCVSVFVAIFSIRFVSSLLSRERSSAKST